MKRTFCICISLVLLLTSSAFALTIYVDKGNTTSIEDGTSDHPYSTIQSAVNMASSGDVVDVQTGTYYENVQITKPLTLRAVSTGTAKISAVNPYASTVDVRSDGVQVSGFVVTGGNWGNVGGGITLNAQKNSVISNNTIEGNGNGIYLDGATNNTIKNNIIRNNSGTGIQLGHYRGTNNNIVTGNEISKNDTGIYVRWSTNTITDNNLIQNGRGITVGEYSKSMIYHNNFIDNSRQYADESGGWARWENGYKDGGNYWSDWTGSDVNLDNVVDQPKGRDFFPVTQPSGWVNIVPSRSIRNVNTGIEYYTFTDAVKEAISGDTIEAKGGSITGIGMYYENVQITKSLTLKAASTGIAKIIAVNPYVSTVDIRSDEVQVSGFVITGSSISSAVGGGITLNAQKNCVIINNSIEGNIGGIYLAGAKNNSIKNNIIRNNSGTGIQLAWPPWNPSNDNIVTGNEISKNGVGIGVGGSNNVITDNNLIQNGNGISVGQYIKSMIYHNNFIDNSRQYSDGSEGRTRWENGYPDGGNHWSDWISPDDFSGEVQDIAGSDGIVDKSYGRDRYPFVRANGWVPQNTPPIANAGQDLKVYTGESFTLDATASFDAEGPISTYNWSFGGGNIYTESPVSFTDGAFDGKTTYAYNQAGSFTVTLTVTDAAGALASDTAVVTVTSFTEGVYSIADRILVLGLPKGPENALLAKAMTAIDALNTGNILTAKTSLQDLINQLSAPGFANRYLPDGTGNIIPEIERIIGLL